MTDFFKKYEIITRIASGGMAEIYEACLHGVEGFQKRVAVKMIRPQLLSEPEFVEMFIKEATLAARLDHPNIVQVNEFDQMDGVYYIVMEFVQGIDLKSALDATGKPWDASLVFYMAAKLLAALDYAHSLTDSYGNPLELIHRDVTPHNILLSVNGQVKLADFGIAKVRDAVSYTKSNMVRGKLHYLSPEQARGEGGGRLDHRSDLFSLGLVLWEMLTGVRRYTAQDGYDIFPQIMEAKFIPPSTLNSALDRRVDDLLHGFLATNKEQRYGSAREALMAVKELFFADCSEQLAQAVRGWVPTPGNGTDSDPTCDMEGSPKTHVLGSADLHTAELTCEAPTQLWEEGSIAGELYASTRQITELRRQVLGARENAIAYDEPTRERARPEHPSTGRFSVPLHFLLSGVLLTLLTIVLAVRFFRAAPTEEVTPAAAPVSAPVSGTMSAQMTPSAPAPMQKLIIIHAKEKSQHPVAPVAMKAVKSAYKGRVILLKGAKKTSSAPQKGPPSKRGKTGTKVPMQGDSLKSISGWD